MSQSARLFVCAAVTLVAAFTAFGVEPAYTGHLGNPEEPAMRPYKWFVRGVRAVAYQTGKAFKEGNHDFPIVGSVYAFRGLRTGLVELERSHWRGMCGANNRTVSYKETGKVNEYINSDVLLRNVADAVTASYAMGVLTASAPVHPEVGQMARESVSVSGPAVQLAGATFAGQKILDRSTPVPEWKSPKERREGSTVSATKKAQRAYIGGRADTNNKRAEGKGNFLKGAKVRLAVE